MQRPLTILDTCAGPNLFCKKELSAGFKLQMFTRPAPNIFDAEKDQLEMLAIIKLRVYLNNRTLTLKLIICKTIETSSFNGTDFCDQHVEVIHSKQRLVEVYSSNCILIIRKHRDRMPPHPTTASTTPLKSTTITNSLNYRDNHSIRAIINMGISLIALGWNSRAASIHLILLEEAGRSCQCCCMIQAKPTVQNFVCQQDNQISEAGKNPNGAHHNAPSSQDYKHNNMCR